MGEAGSGRPRTVRIAASALCIGWLSGAVAASDPTRATLWGVVLDASGKPIAGARVVVAEPKTGRELLAPPTDAAGTYELQVVPGQSWVPIAVTMPGGERLVLPAADPIPVAAPKRYRIDVRVFAAARPAAVPPDPRERPWWRRPSGITGLVLVHAAVIAVLAASESEPPASPSVP